MIFNLAQLRYILVILLVQSVGYTSKAQSIEFYTCKKLSLESYQFVKTRDIFEVYPINKDNKKVYKRRIKHTNQNNEFSIIINKKKKTYSIFDPSKSKNHQFNYKKKSYRKLYLQDADSLILEKVANQTKSWRFLKDDKEILKFTFKKSNRQKGIEFTSTEKYKQQEILKIIAFQDYAIYSDNRTSLSKNFLFFFLLGIMR